MCIRDRRRDEREAELRSMENIKHQLDAEAQMGLQQKEGMRQQFDQVFQENAALEHAKEEQRQQQKEEDVRLNAEYARRLEQEELNRRAQHEAIAARGHKLAAQQSGTYTAIADAKEAEEAAFLQRLQELEEIEARREHEQQSKRSAEREQYRAALEEQVQHKGMLRRRQQQEVLSERDRMFREIDQATSEENKKQAEAAQRQSQYLRDIQTQMHNADGGVAFDRRDHYGGAHSKSVNKSSCDGNFYMSETERRMNGL
eukprot:TRINITY_DN16555_c0_g1_i4.p1 TRINITY_DN16555_c0_g1~~TRINITY_DN16555_c0_g1_i4.p1  ORF type:complete len:258 (-),score=107.69 TRINITY_DN16555_c0_g1_i4:125-898(-)